MTAWPNWILPRGTDIQHMEHWKIQGFKSNSWIGFNPCVLTLPCWTVRANLFFPVKLCHSSVYTNYWVLKKIIVRLKQGLTVLYSYCPYRKLGWREWPSALILPKLPSCNLLLSKYWSGVKCLHMVGIWEQAWVFALAKCLNCQV